VKPTPIRHQILATATIVAFLMYLDRICLTQIIASDSFKQHIKLEGWQSDWVKGSFFWAYALAQVPAGWLSDRFGARMLISFYIAAWSIFTMAASFSVGFVTLALARIGCGLAEAGYYPASSSLLTRWAHVEARGFASSMISWGGRVGGALAPALTAYVIVQAGDWRWAGWLYGALGVAVAWIYWHVFREHPKLHPKCNAAEIDLLGEGRGEFLPIKEPPKRFPLLAACRSGNLWLANGVQFFTNIGWAFLVLSLPDYLKDVKHLDDKSSGYISSLALFIGIVALPLGGWFTDVLTRRMGRRLGRMLPMSMTKFLSAGCYLLALRMDSPWSMAVAFGLVTFFVDFGLPAMWTTMQDISGKHQAQLFGWSNMWGNFGAGILPVLFGAVLARYDINHDFHEGVWLCAGALVMAGLLGLWLNAEKPVTTDQV
jgi:MFS family permease